MVIPVCFKCEKPVQMLSVPQNGVETIHYRCAACSHASAGFLLGFVDPIIPNNPTPESERLQRAQFFSDTTQNYKLRAKMQGLLDLKNDGLHPGAANESVDAA